MWSLVRETGTMDVNSAYAYLMLGQYFPESCVLAEIDGEIVGFLSGFIPRKRPDTLFVWQIVVAHRARGHGLARRMLNWLLARSELARVRQVEATVTPTNTASWNLFQSLARCHGAAFVTDVGFPAELFPDAPDGQGHESEHVVRVGPLADAQSRAAMARDDQPAAPAESGDGTDESESKMTDMDVFATYESDVRSYSRDFPVVFRKARGFKLYDESGKAYLDFVGGAGALNYGHNEPTLKKALLAHIEADGITHGLDMATTPRGRFLQRFNELILSPRGMDHKVLLPGPTGTNAVEAALKLARRATGRETVVSFTNGFHGMTLGSLAVTGNAGKRAGAGISLSNTVFVPYEGTAEGDVDGLSMLESMLANSSSGLDKPAAAIVETVQGEGGVNVASAQWLQRLEQICRAHGMLLIVDDIQAGCGRTGSFFSFEEAGIDPQIVTLSKSLSGYGLPMSAVLVKPAYDRFAPGQHNGTFRGNNHAFVTATTALETYWADDSLTSSVRGKADVVAKGLGKIAAKHKGLEAHARGRGLMQGLVVGVPGLAEEIAAQCFERRMLVETAGADDEVIKLLPPLTIDEAALRQGLKILDEACVAALKARSAKSAA